MNEFEQRTDLSGLNQSVTAIREALSSRIIGQETLLNQMMVALLARGHVLIEGVPGVAKTLAARGLAKCINTSFSRIQFTPDLMPSDVLGTTIFNQKNSEFELRKGPIYANLVLIDEINRAPAKTQAALFEVMEEFQVSVDGHSEALDEPFMVLATQNPVDHEGTYRLPEAQLDRFMLKILVDYPGESDELQVLKMHHTTERANPLDGLEAVMDKNTILEARERVRKITADEGILDYINRIIRNSRNFPGIFLGASPRAGVALLMASKAWAAIQGRDFVTPDDVKEMALPALRHRVLLSPEKEMEGALTDDLIRDVLNQVEVPR